MVVGGLVVRGRVWVCRWGGIVRLRWMWRKKRLLACEGEGLDIFVGGVGGGWVCVC